MLRSKGAAWFCSSHVSSVYKVLGLILTSKAWIMQFLKSKTALQQGCSPLHNKVQGPEVESETVSQISHMCLYHTPIFAQLEVKLRSNRKMHALCGHWGQRAQADKNMDFSTGIFVLFHPLFSINCQAGYGAQQPSTLTHFGLLITIKSYVQNNENILVPQLIFPSQKYFSKQNSSNEQEQDEVTAGIC